MTSSDATPPVPPGWPHAQLGQGRGLMMAGRFDDALAVADQASRRARRDAEHGTWHTFRTLYATALMNLLRFEEALAACDEVVDSAVRHHDLAAQADAGHVAAVAAERLGRHDEALQRIDAALSVGERIQERTRRPDVLSRAAAAAGAIGMAELGDSIFALVMGDIEAGVAGDLNPGHLLWIKSEQVKVRFDLALAREHTGASGAAELYTDVVLLCRRVFDGAPYPSVIPPLPAAVFHSREGFALAALGRHDEADRRLSSAAAALSGQSFGTMSAAVQLLCALADLRAGAPTGPEGTRSLVDIARRLADGRLEAEVWRLTARRADDPVRAASADERFEELADALDWRSRLQAAAVVGLRSAILRGVAENV